MIYQYQLTLSSEERECIPSFWAYRLYAWMLSQLPEEEAERFHEQERRVISQHLSRGVWTVNLLEEEAISQFGPVLERAEEIVLHADHLNVVERQVHRIGGAKELLQKGRALRQRRVELEIVSPAAFRRGGRYAIFPSEDLLIQSLVMHWNELYPEYLLDDTDMLEALYQGVHVVDYRLRTGRFQLKNTAIPCFYGTVFIEAKLPVVLHEIWNALLCAAPYFGIGIKTTLGMGGIQAILPDTENESCGALPFR